MLGVAYSFDPRVCIERLDKLDQTGETDEASPVEDCNYYIAKSREWARAANSVLSAFGCDEMTILHPQLFVRLMDQESDRIDNAYQFVLEQTKSWESVAKEAIETIGGSHTNNPILWIERFRECARQPLSRQLDEIADLSPTSDSTLSQNKIIEDWKKWANYAIVTCMKGKPVNTPEEFCNEFDELFHRLPTQADWKDKYQSVRLENSAWKTTAESILAYLDLLADSPVQLSPSEFRDRLDPFLDKAKRGGADFKAKIYSALGSEKTEEDPVSEVSRLIETTEHTRAILLKNTLILDLLNVESLDDVVPAINSLQEWKELSRILCQYLDLDPDKMPSFEDIEEKIDKLKHASLKDAIEFWIDDHGESWSSDYVANALKSVERVLNLYYQYSVLQPSQIAFIPLEPVADIRDAIERFAEKDQHWELEKDELIMLQHAITGLIRNVVKLDRRFHAKYEITGE